MYQIDNSTAASSIPASTGAGTPGFFTDGNPATGTAATIVPAEFMNMLMMENINVLAAAGINPSKSNFTQLASAIKIISQSAASVFATDTGSVNAYAASYSIPVIALLEGLSLRFKASTSNTGPCTFTPAPGNGGLAAKPLVTRDNSAMIGGEINVGSYCTVVYSVALGSWILTQVTAVPGFPGSPYAQSAGAYPKGALLPNSTFTGYWYNTVDTNSKAPEVTNASLTGWIPAFNPGITAVTGLAASSVTLTALQAAKERITLAGVLTANVSVILTLWAGKRWTVTNNCTGAFSVTVIGPTGTGVVIPAGTTSDVTCDGTNIVLPAKTLASAGITDGMSLAVFQGAQATYGLDTGVANTYTVPFTPAISSATDGMVLRFKAKTANTGASTFSPNGISAAAIVGGAHSPLQGGEIIANGDVWVQWNSSIGGGSWVLIDSTGGALQVAPATKSQQVVQLSQVAAITGSTRNGRMYLSSASATATYTADEVVVKSALGASPWVIPSFSKTINLASTGAGGMDTGSAPVSGFVAIYAIYNPTTSTSALLAIDATSAVAPEIYGGANMPAGYTASALLAVVPTNASSQIVACRVADRQVSMALYTPYAASAAVTGQAISIASTIPKNAISVQGESSVQSTSASNVTFAIGGDAAFVGQQNFTTSISANLIIVLNFFGVPVVTPQTLYITTASSAGTPAFKLYISGYSI